MDTELPSRSLFEQAESLKSMFQPTLHQRKPRVVVPGVSTLPATQQAVTSPESPQFPYSDTPTPSYASGVQFRSVLTPKSLLHPVSQPLLPPNVIPALLPPGPLSIASGDTFILPTFPESISESELDGLACEFILLRWQRTSTYNKIHGLLAELRRERISPIDILIQVLDPDNISYHRYRRNLHRDDSTKVTELFETNFADRNGRGKLLDCMRPHLEEFACKTIADEMETRRPFLTSILTAASQTERPKKQNKHKKPDKVQTIPSSGTSGPNLVQSFGDGCTAEAAEFAATEPHGLGYDNMNISTSIFVEQRGANGPAKVTSGTFGVLYGLRNAKLDHMLIAPIMKRFRESTGLRFNRDIR
ncbi:hypothetical protein B0H13DRAFT_1890420 [Mycena leptocephala]|nr:hypothetical protein B0H13DRAFT_1890420 [Mycena leptocephala]